MHFSHQRNDLFLFIIYSLLRLSLNIDCNVLADSKAPYILNCYSDITGGIVCRVNRFNFNIAFRTFCIIGSFCSIFDLCNLQDFIVLRSYSNCTIFII